MGAKESANLVVSIHNKQRSTKLNRKMIVRCLRILLLLAIAAMVTVVVIDRWVTYQTRDNVLSSPEQVDKFSVAVVLGTSKYLGRTLNEYYTHRIDAAIELFKNGKVDNLLLSGDNAHRSYNEPWTMKRDLLKAGIPDEHLFLDYAGFRTLDSVVRAKKIFDTDNFLIISQRFHCERALFIADYHDIHAKCLAVPGPTSHSGFKVRLREVFARTKAFLDLYVIGTQPKFLGPKEPILKPEDDEQADVAEAQIDNSL